MKLIGIAAFCLFSPYLILNAIAQSDNLIIKKLRLDSVTAKGKPIGEETSQEIDKDGGKIFSEDSKMELIFPEGALSKKKKINIHY